MDETFFCRACGAEHQEPAEATLGHLVSCLECFMFEEGHEAVVAVTIELVEIRAAA